MRVFVFLMIFFFGSNINSEVDPVETYSMPSRKEKVIVYSISLVGVGGVYYVSKYPKVLGCMWSVSGVLGIDGDSIESTLLMAGLPAIYNFFLVENVVDDDERFEVFATNIGLFATGAIMSKMFFNKKEVNTFGFRIDPVFLSDSMGLALTNAF